MSFGKVAFSGSRFIFWSVAPVLLVSAIGLPLVLDRWTVVKGIGVALWSIGCVLAIFALRDARRYWWAARGLTALLLAAYVAYLVDEFATVGGLGFGRPDASPLNALLGLIAIGVPCFWYTVFGRFSLRSKRPPGKFRTPTVPPEE